MAKVSRPPSGSQAHALDSSWGRNIARSRQPARRATSAVASSSRARVSPTAWIVTQHTTPT